MAYTSMTDLTNRFGTRMLVMLTDRADPATGNIDAGVINAAIAGAGALIDGYLAARYSLPLADTPPLIAELAEDIAIYKLHIASTDPKIEDDYKAAIGRLKDISAGSIRLPLAGITPTETGGSGARITDRERPLTAANLKGFI